MLNSSQDQKPGARIWAWLAILLIVTSILAGCEDRRDTETSAFEAAEVHYRHGNYGEALDGYQAFIKRYPQSPLASTVEMRIRSIHREVESVMTDRHALRPSYHGSQRVQSDSTPDQAGPSAGRPEAMPEGSE